MGWIECRAIIRFLSLEGQIVKNSKCLSNVYARSAPWYATVTHWLGEFRRGSGTLKTNTILVVNLRWLMKKMSRKCSRWCLKIEKSAMRVKFTKHACQWILFIPSCVNVCQCLRCVLDGYWECQHCKWKMTEAWEAPSCWPGKTQTQNSPIHVWLLAMRREFITITSNLCLNRRKGNISIFLDENVYTHHHETNDNWFL